MVFPDVSAAVLATTAAGVVALLVVIEAAKLIRARRNRVSWERAKTLLTTAEGDVLRRLESAVAGRAVIFAKVWIGDLVQPPSGPQPEEREWSRLHLPRHRVDFVLCSPEDYGIIGVVVLDTGGRRRKRPPQDQALERLCQGACLPVLRVDLHDPHPPEVLKELIDTRLFGEPSAYGGRREPTLGPLPALREEPGRREPTVGDLDV